MTDIEVPKLSKKILSFILKMMYLNYGTKPFDLYDLNQILQKFGLYTQVIVDTTFIYEAIKLNERDLSSNTLSVENLILPELKNLEIGYSETYSEVVTYYYNFGVDSYTSNKRMLENFFSDEGNDYIEPTNHQPNDKDYGDSERLDNRIIAVS